MARNWLNSLFPRPTSRTTRRATLGQLAKPSLMTLEDRSTPAASTFSIDNVSLSEGNSGTTNATFTVTLNVDPADIGETLTVKYTTANGITNPATAGSDYTADSNTLSFTPAPGDTTLTLPVMISVNGDIVVEQDETFFVNLSNPNSTGATTPTITTSQGVGTITNDDMATLSIANSSATEGNAITFTATLTSPVDVPVTVTLTPSKQAGDTATATTDFSTAAKTITISAGSTTGSTTVSTVTDNTVELDETFTATLSGLNAGGRNVTIAGAGTATGTITNDDSATVSVSATTTGSATEGGTISYTATLTNPVDVNVTVDLTPSKQGGDTATAGTDFDNTVKTITILAGQLTGTTTVSTVPDNTVELDETFTVTIGNVQASGRNVTLGATTTATGTIVNDDSATVSIAPAAATEGSDVMFTVTLSNPVDVPVTVKLTPSKQGGNTATATTDFDPTAITVSIPAGSTTGTGAVPTVPDNIVELDETFTATISNLSAGGRAVSLATTTATGTITNDDSATVSVANSSATEGSAITFTATLSQAVDTNVTVDLTATLQASGVGKAKANDFTANQINTPMTITILAGQLTGATTITSAQDTRVEGPETFDVTLGNLSAGGRNVTLGTSTAVGTIIDDDSATISIAPAAAAEGTGVAFTVSLSNIVDADVTVDVTPTTKAGNTATSGTDYNAGKVTVTILAGTLSTTATINTVTDTTVELDETFTATLSNVQDGTNTVTIGTASAIGTITNDDSATVSIANSSATEGSPITFTATLTNPVDVNVTVTLTPSTQGGDTATATTDYSTTAKTITILAGQLTGTTTVGTVSDNTVELDETFTATLSGVNATGRNVTIAGAGTATGTITNDDSATISIANAAATEGSGIVFTATLSNPVDTTVTVTLTPSTQGGDTATAVTDYSVTPQTITIPAGQLTGTATVNTVQDNLVEQNETFTATLSGVSASGRNVTILGAGTATGTINNDDSASLSIDSPSITEGDAGSQLLTFTVTLTGDVAGGLMVAYNTADNTATVANNDYVFTSGTLTFAGNSGETQTFTVAINGDTIVEGNETFFAQLGAITTTPASLAASINKSNGTGTINNNDQTTLTVVNVTQAENGGPMTFTYTSSNAVQGGFTVTASTADGTGANDKATTADNDYVAKSSPLVFTGAAGETQTFTVTINNDAKVEADEKFSVSLSNAAPGSGLVNAADIKIATPGATGTGTITNDDSTALSIANVTQAEDAGKMTFTVKLSNPVQGGFTVQYKTTDGTAVSTNTGVVGDNDFSATTGTLTFAGNANETQTFQVTINADAVVEPDEQFVVSLFNVVPNNPLIAPVSKIDATATATGTITNDDAANVTVSDATATEGGSLTFTVALSGAVDVPVTVTFDTASGTATSGATMTQGTDFIGVNSKTITFAPGETVKTVVISTVDDLRVEGTETFGTTITNLITTAKVSITDGAGVGTITDNDTASLTYDLASSSTLEDNTTKTIGLTLTVNAVGAVGVVGLDRTIDPGITLSAPQPTQGAGPLADYKYTGPTPATFAAGSDGASFTRTVTIDVFEDLSNEGDETVTLSFVPSDGSNGQLSIGANPTHAFTILNDDGTNRTYDATAAGTYKLVRSGGNIQLYLGASLIAQDVLGTSPIVLNGTGGAETFVIDYSGGNPVPTGGVTFNGGAGSDAIIIANGTFTNVSDSFANTTDGTLLLDGSTVNYTGADDAQLNVPIANLTFNLPPAATPDALLQDSGAQSKLTGSTFVSTTFNKPSASLALNRGTANDVLSVGTLAGSTANITVGTSGAQFKTITQTGAVTTTKDVAYFGDTIAINGVLTAANAKLVAGTAATQAAQIATGILTLGETGNAGDYTLANAANDAATLTVPAAKSVTYQDANDLSLGSATTTNVLSATAGGNLTVTTGVTAQSTAGDVVLFASKNLTTTSATVKAGASVSATAGNNVTSNTGTVQAGTTVAINAGDDLSATGATLQAGTTIAIAIDTNNDKGATADLRTATITATNTTIAGNASADTFRVTGYTTPVSIDGKNPTAAPGDALEFDAQGKAVTATATSFNTAGAPVSYANIETVTLLNVGAFTLNGDDKGVTTDDRVTVTRTAAGPLQYQFDGKPAVNIAGVSNFTFNGLAGRDTLVVDYSKGSPVPAGGIVFNGGADADFGLAVVGNGNTSAVVKATAAGAGLVTVDTADKIAYAGLEPSSEVDVNNVPTVTVDTTAITDNYTIVGDTTNSATRLTPANTLNIAGAANLPTVRLSNSTNVTLNTNPAGTDTVTINGATNAHNVTNLTITAPDDAITGTAPLQVAGNLSVEGKDITLQANGNLSAGGDLVVTNNGTLTIGSASLVAQHVTQKTANPVALNGNAFVQANATTGDTVVFNGPVDGPGGLMVFNKGNTVFNKAVGGTTALSNLVTDAGGQTVVNGGLVKTAALQSYGDRVVTSATKTQLIATAGKITFFDEVAPTTDGLDLVIGGPMVDVTAAQGVNAATKFGTLQLANANTATFFGPVTALTKVEQVNGTGTTTFASAVTAPTVQITNGNNVTFNGPVAASAKVEQVTGLGTTTFNGSVTTPILQIDNGTNLVFNGPVAASTRVQQVAGAGTTTFNGTVTTPLVQIDNGTNFTFNGGVVVDRFVQTAGAGTTTLTDVTANAATPVTGGSVGGPINVKTTSIVLKGSVLASAGPVVLGLTGGTATQPSGRIDTPAVYLVGNGAFTLNSAANAFRADTGDVFANLSSGSINVSDSTDLVIAFDPNNPGVPAINITNPAPAPGADAVTLTTPGNFTANDPANTDTVDPAALTKMFVVPAGTVQVNFGSDTLPHAGNKFFTVIYRAEATASRVTIGRPTVANDSLANKLKDVFIVRPMIGARLVVNGNDPPAGTTDGDNLKLQSVGISGVTLNSQGSGNGTYTFDRYMPLDFTSIENIGGLSVEAFAVQTAPRAGSTATNGYAIRVGGTNVSDATATGGASSVAAIPGQIRGSGSPSNAFVVSPALGTVFTSFTPPSLAFGDVNGDTTPDLIIGSGAGSNPTVTIINGLALTQLTNKGFLDLTNLQPGQLLARFDAYESSFQGGVNVTAADFDNDRKAEIIVGSGVGGGPRIRIFSGSQIAAQGTAFTGSNLGDLFRPDFFPYEESFRGGVNVAAGDLNGDGRPDLIAGAGVGGGPRVRIYNGAEQGSLLNDFFAYEPGYRGGVLVAAGRFNSDPIDDLMTAPGSNGGPRLRIFAGIKYDPTLGGPPAGSVFTQTPTAIVDTFAFDFDPSTPPQQSGLIPGGDPATLGVGSIAFGASTNGSGSDRTVLVARPRGTSFQVYRYSHAIGSTTLVLDPTVADARNYEDTLNGGSHAIDLGDGTNPISFDLLTGGGTVAGGTFT